MESDVNITRIPPFQEWKKRKLLVIHMEAPHLDVETCLKLARIPFSVLEFDDEKLINKIKTQLNECIGIIITGSINYGQELPAVPNMVMEAKVPKLGLCYGCEELGQFLGANIIDCNPPLGEKSEVAAKLEKCVLFDGIDTDDQTMVTMAHDNMIDKVPDGCRVIASTDLTPVAGFECPDMGIFGLQFHPEKGWLGDIIFKNFFNFCEDFKSGLN
jgi:GMP synthase-like glutamine amidotransferase